MYRSVLAGGVVLLMAGLPPAAFAQGASPRLYLGAAASSSPAASSEKGVRVWRGATTEDDFELLGDETPAREADCGPKEIVVTIRSNPARRLRTQGFYSGPGRKGYKFTQGFYSGQQTYR